MQKKQAEFPLLTEYKKHFPVTEDTIFAYDHVIYTNKDLPEDIIVHEKQHFIQQDRDGRIRNQVYEFFVLYLQMDYRGLI